MVCPEGIIALKLGFTLPVTPPTPTALHGRREPPVGQFAQPAPIGHLAQLPAQRLLPAPHPGIHPEQLADLTGRHRRRAPRTTPRAVGRNRHRVVGGYRRKACTFFLMAVPHFELFLVVSPDTYHQAGLR